MEAESQRHNPPGETSASPQRAAERLTAPALAFDLHAELAQIRREESWLRGNRNAKTLVKEPHLRLTLVALKAGARLNEHQTDGPVTISTVQGRLRIAAGGETHELSPGQLLALQVAVPHEVEAVEESAFLLTVGSL